MAVLFYIHVHSESQCSVFSEMDVTFCEAYKVRMTSTQWGHVIVETNERQTIERMS